MLSAIPEASNQRLLLLYLCECFEAGFIIWFACCRSFYFPWVGSCKLLLNLASTVILGSEFSRTHGRTGSGAAPCYFPWVVWLLFHQVRRLYNIKRMTKWIEETAFLDHADFIRNEIPSGVCVVTDITSSRKTFCSLLFLKHFIYAGSINRLNKWKIIPLSYTYL
jgi:hypothetical protein